MSQKYRNYSLFFFLLVCLFVELLASYWTSQSVFTWYPLLLKPSWTPPSWVFGPVWTILYGFIACSGWLIYTAKASDKRSISLTVYWLQLLLNVLWSFLFFSLKNPLAGLIDLVLLSGLIFFTIFTSWSVRPSAALLLIPYLIWVLYAGSLNVGICVFNE